MNSVPPLFMNNGNDGKLLFAEKMALWINKILFIFFVNDDITMEMKPVMNLYGDLR